MKTRRFFVSLLLTAMFSFSLFNITAFASNNLQPYVPGGQPSVSAPGQQNPSDNTSGRDYAGELFQSTEIVTDPGVNQAVSTVTKWVSVLVTLVLSFFPLVCTIQAVIDVVCIVLEPVAVLVAKVPFPINSKEAMGITGIQREGAQGVENIDLKGQNPVVCYFVKRGWTLFFGVVFCLLLGTGLLFDIIFFAANHVVGWISGII